VERSVVLAAGGSARIPVKCVEAGRWAPRDDQSARSFQVSERTGVRTRWSTSQNMADQLARHGRFAAEQATVWQQVDEELTRCAVSSRTRSYEAYLQGVKRRLLDEVRRAEVRPPLVANGLVLFPRGGGFWVEAYPSPDALAEHADDLLADLFDPNAGAAGSAPANAAPARTPPREDADRLLGAIASTPLRLLEPIAGTIGDAYAFGDGQGAVDGAAGAVLLVDGALAHVGGGAAPLGREGLGASCDRPRGSQDGAEDGPKPRALAHASQDGAEDGPKPRALARAAIDPLDEGSSAAGEAAGSSRSSGRSGLVVVSSGSSDRGRAGGSAARAPVGAAPGSEGGNERPRVDLETMRGIYGRARDLLPEGPPARERVQGYRLVRVLDRNISWVDVRIGGDGYAVLGSHDRCDLVLSSDAGIWLRHLAAICVRLEDDGVGLRLIDLKTDLPFFLDDDTARWSVLARGPFAMRLGRHVVCGFPIGPAAGEGAAALQASPRAASPGDTAAPRDGETGVIAASIAAAPARSVAVMPGPNELSNFVASAPVSQIQDLLGPSSSPNHVRVTLERGGMGASVELPAETLDAGVLLGRALNCFDGGLRRIFCEAISRAHVLLVRDREDVFAFDLCSTNGTRVGGQRIRRYRLSDAGSTLELGKKVTFRWHRREGA
jgi:hypothetical protein